MRNTTKSCQSFTPDTLWLPPDFFCSTGCAAQLVYPVLAEHRFKEAKYAEGCLDMTTLFSVLFLEAPSHRMSGCNVLTFHYR